MAMDLLSLSAKITVDTSEYDKGLDDAEGKAQGFGSKLKSGLATAGKIGAAAIGAVTTAATAVSGAMVKGASDVAQYGDNIDKMSQKMGISAEAYQEWDAVLQHSGTSIEALKPSMKTLANAAQTGADEFKKLGISEEEVANLSQEDLFSRVIAGLQGMEEGTERTAITAKLLGRGATELGALLNTSAEDTQAMKDRVHELGGVMSDEAVKASAKFQDNLQDLQTTFAGVKRGITTELLPGLNGIMEGFTSLLVGEEGAEDALDKGFDNLFSGLDKGISKLSDVAGKIVPRFIDLIIELLPQLATLGVQIINGIATSIIDNLPMLVSAAVELLTILGQTLVENLPMLVTTAATIIQSLATYLTEALPELIPAIVDIILEIVNTLLDNVDMLIDCAVNLIVALATGIVNAIPKLVEKAPIIIIRLVEAIVKALPKILQLGAQLIMTLIEGVLGAVSGIVKLGGDIVDFVKNGFDKKVQEAKSWGKDMIDNFVNGIKERWQRLKDSITSIAQGIKDILGFSEPKDGPLSNFHTYAPDMIDLFVKGLNDSDRKLRKAVGATADVIADGMQVKSVDASKSASYNSTKEVPVFNRDINVNLKVGSNQFGRAVITANQLNAYRSGGF